MERAVRRRVLLPAGVAFLAACIAGGTFALETTPPGLRDGRAAEATPRYLFRDVTQAAGVYDEGRTWGAAWTDFEDDGDPDLFLGRHWREPLIFLNDGSAGFDRMPTPPDLMGTHMDRHACAWGEANRDGRVDLLCTQGADNGNGRGPNQLLLNTGDSLKDRAHNYGIQYPRARGRTVNWVDYDLDGDLDVFLGSMLRPGVPMALFEKRRGAFHKVDVGLSLELSVLSSAWADWDRDGDSDLLVTQHYPLGAVAFENLGGKSFRPVTLRRITGRKWMSATWGDFNGDGWVDLQTASRKKLRVFRNAGGRLRPVYQTRLRQGRAGTWFDVDNDGDLDSFVVQGAPGNRERTGVVNWRDFLLIRKKGRFERVEGPSFRGPRGGNGESATAADFDRDGRVDLFVTNGLHYWQGPTELLHNLSRAGNWAGIELAGPRKNPLAYGAVVKWRAGGRVFERQLLDGVVYRAQSEGGYVHLGLRKASTARLKVMWPGGARDCTRVSAGAIVTIEKGTLECP